MCLTLFCDRVSTEMSELPLRTFMPKCVNLLCDTSRIYWKQPPITVTLIILPLVKRFLFKCILNETINKHFSNISALRTICAGYNVIAWISAISSAETNFHEAPLSYRCSIFFPSLCPFQLLSHSFRCVTIFMALKPNLRIWKW